MPVYEYEALDDKGKTTKGIIDADSPQTARQKIRSGGGFPVSVKEVSDAATVKDKTDFSISTLFSRIRPSEIAMFTRQLATLLGAGFPLVTAIETLISQTRTQALAKITARIKESVVEGNTFASALAMYPNVFSNIYINMVEAGESSGTLEIVLDRLAEITEKQQQLKSRINTAMAYPILMTLIGSLVLFFLLTFVVPNITSIFDDMNQVLPTPTRFLIGASDIFKAYWWGLFILAAAAFVALKMIRKTEKGLYTTDKIFLSMPFVGLITRKLAAARFSRTLGSLLDNGVTMLPALEIVKNITGNVLVSQRIEMASDEVEKGQALAASLGQGDVFPHLCVQMIQVGEQSGDLEAMLYKVADVYENEVESTIMSMMAMLEPVMILVMAVVVLFIVLSICLPIFEMNQLVG